MGMYDAMMKRFMITLRSWRSPVSWSGCFRTTGSSRCSVLKFKFLGGNRIIRGTIGDIKILDFTVTD